MSKDLEPLILIVTTCDRREVLEQIAHELIEGSLAACCQISGPMTSVYRWQGEVEKSEEYRCDIKSKRQNFSRIEETILRIHSYDVPQVVAIEISEVSKSYHVWASENL